MDRYEVSVRLLPEVSDHICYYTRIIATWLGLRYRALTSLVYCSAARISVSRGPFRSEVVGESLIAIRGELALRYANQPLQTGIICLIFRNSVCIRHRNGCWSRSKHTSTYPADNRPVSRDQSNHSAKEREPEGYLLFCRPFVYRMASRHKATLPSFPKAVTYLPLSEDCRK
jgi:hypothetical protein